MLYEQIFSKTKTKTFSETFAYVRHISYTEQFVIPWNKVKLSIWIYTIRILCYFHLTVLLLMTLFLITHALNFYAKVFIF